nr:hypothetical protein CFP56_75174 [Quercus suber]
MKEMTPVQPCPESTTVQEGAKEDHDRYKSGNSMGNDNSSLKPIKTTDQIIKPAINSMSYGIPEKSTNEETLPAKESYTAVVPGKEKEDELISGTCDGINYQRPNQELNKKIPHVTTTASTQAKRVLPSWTRRCRPVTQT